MRPTCALALILLIAATPVLASSQPLVLVAPDGVRLKATYYAAERPGPGVLLLHMCGGDRSAWTGLGRKLAAAGIHALALDFRSYGESGGTAPEGFGVERQRWIDEKWPGDVDAAFEHLASRPGVDRTRMGAAGASCGVNQAIHLARRHPDEVRTLALLAGGPNRAGQEFLERNPWMPLFGAAALDDGRAVEAMEWTLTLAGNPGNVLRSYPDGGHGTEIFAAHDDLEPAIVGWFEEHLVRHPATRPAADAPAVARAPSPRVEVWNELHAPGGAAQVLSRFEAARAEGETLPLPPEGPVNGLGYELIQAGRLGDAIAVLRLNVAAHPDSANAYDSLGDAFLAAGRREDALALARATLEKLANDPNSGEAYRKALRDAAEHKIQELTQGD